jgi:DNA repair protein RecO (recombination protein O)
MALVSLDVLETVPTASLDLVLVAFLLKALAMHGYRPALDACASCGSGLDGYGSFSVEAGGAVCGSCGGGGVRLSEDARLLMRALMRAKLADVAGLDVPEDVRTEALRVVRAYVGYHVPARLKAFDLYMRAL